MVFFTCNSCGESLKKNKVDKHLSQCRSKSVSCVDCGKDFTYDYNNHNQCVSEDQKYGGLDYKPKENSMKGKTKQEEWVQKVKTAINNSNCSQHIKGLLNRLSSYDNIPRKKQKFFNFVRSCLHVNNEYYAQQMWDVFETTIKSDDNNTQNNGTQSKPQNGVKRDSNDSDIKETKKKKHKSDENEDNICDQEMNGSQEETQDVDQTQDIDNETNGESKPKLKIRKIVVQILNECEDKSLSVKKLRKKVIKRIKSMDESLSKDQISSKFFSKLEKIKKIEKIGEIVSLKDRE